MINDLIGFKNFEEISQSSLGEIEGGEAC